jgi:anti-anti-sigma factor
VDVVEPLEIAVTETEGTVVVRLVGEVDSASVDLLRAALHDAVTRRPLAVRIDAERLDFICSTGMSSLLAFVAVVDPTPVTIVEPTPAVRQVVLALGLADSLFDPDDR